MADDTVSQPIIFKICHEILQEKVAPIKYRELTNMALEKLYYPEVNMFRQIEDVREQFQKRQGVGYIGEPYCVFYLKSWVSPQTLINPLQPIMIAANIKDSLRACYEAVLRFPHMQNKYGLTREQHARMTARGLLTEQHVTGWFCRQFNGMVSEPDNAGIWDRPCSHDFKIVLPNYPHTWLIDVAGEHSNHNWGNSPGKKPTDIHIIANIDDNRDEIIMQGYITRKNFVDVIHADFSQPIQKLIFYLNTLKLNYDYSMFRNGD